jgi:alpha-1,3-rhamnosyltransferase
MSNSPLVSVLIPAFNHERYVQETIGSIIAQTYPRLELIIINDGSSDSTHQKIKEIEPACKARFSHYTYVLKENQGVATSLNIGIRLATGTHMFFLASDDRVEPHAVSVLLHSINRLDERYALACGDADYIDATGRKVYLDFLGCIRHTPHARFFSSFLEFRTRVRNDFDFKGSDFGSYESFLGGNYIPVGLLVKRRALLDVGLFDERIPIEDLDMWLKLSKKYKMKYIHDTLSHYRLHGLNTILTRKPLMIKSILQLLLREKTYCCSNGLEEKWNRSFANTLVTNFRFLSRRDAHLFLGHISFADILRYGAFSVAAKTKWIPNIAQSLLL